MHLALEGMQNEIYRVKLKKEIYGGYSFGNAVKAIYICLNIIVIGIELRMGQGKKVFIGPIKYILDCTEDYYCYAINSTMPDLE